MGDLIVMTRPTRSPDRPPMTGASAEILFFTGVRMVRAADDGLPPPPIRRRRRPRETLA